MTDLNASQGQQLRRVLKPRHLNMIAIGGSIGTGLFVASGATVATAGPGGALLSYCGEVTVLTHAKRGRDRLEPL